MPDPRYIKQFVQNVTTMIETDLLHFRDLSRASPGAPLCPRPTPAAPAVAGPPRPLPAKAGPTSDT